MLRILLLTLAVLFAGCLQNDSSSPSSADSAQSGDDTSDDNDGAGNDSSGNDSSGSDSGNSGTETPDGTGNNTSDCGWAELSAADFSITLGNTSAEDSYDISNFSERTDLNTGLTGTWVLMHNVASQHDSSADRSRTLSESWQKFIFVIRDNGNGPEAASCMAPGFTALDDTSGAFSLPLFNTSNEAGEAMYPQFTRSSNSRLQGSVLEDFDYRRGNEEVRFLSQSTVAVKISASVAPLGTHSLSMNYGPELINAANDNVWCLQQARVITQQQSCRSAAQPPALSLQLLTSAEQGLASFDLRQQEGTILQLQLYKAAANYLLAQPDAASNLSATFGNSSFSFNAQLNDGFTWSNADISASSDYSVSVP